MKRAIARHREEQRRAHFHVSGGSDFGAAGSGGATSTKTSSLVNHWGGAPPPLLCTYVMFTNLSTRFSALLTQIAVD